MHVKRAWDSAEIGRGALLAAADPAGHARIGSPAADPGQRAGHAAGLLMPGRWPAAGTITTSDPGQQRGSLLPVADRHRTLRAEQENGRHLQLTKRAGQ